MNRPTISAAVIALNEERNLPGLLASLGWLDEVVIVDGGSRDRTVKRARELGATVVARPFDNYAAQRNFAIDQTRGDWVFSVDADERPTPALAREIRRAAGNRRYAAWHVPINSTIFGRRVRYCGTQDDRPVRLFRRDLGRWHGDVHEVLRVGGRVGHLRRALLHHTLEDLESFLRKMNRYTRLEAAARVARGQPPRARDRWLAPLREFARRLVWKQGVWDGPNGWSFCALSGLSEYVLAQRHRELWNRRQAAAS